MRLIIVYNTHSLVPSKYTINIIIIIAAAAAAVVVVVAIKAFLHQSPYGKKTFGGDRNAYYLDCGHGFTSVHVR